MHPGNGAFYLHCSESLCCAVLIVFPICDILPKIGQRIYTTEP